MNIPGVLPVRWTTPPAASAPARVVPSEREIADAVDALLHDGRDQRIQMAKVSGGFQLFAGLLGTGLAAVAGVPGLVVGTTIGAIGGAVLGVYESRRFMEGQDRFMTGYTFWALGGFGAFIAAASTLSGGPVAGALASAGAAALAAVAGGALRNRNLAHARDDVRALDKRLDQAIDFEAMVKRDLDNKAKAQQPQGRVDVGDDYVIVGGIRVKRS